MFVIFYGLDSLNHFSVFSQPTAFYSLFFLKKCLPFVYIMWRSWYVSNRKKINSPSKHFQRFLFFCWFLLTFCFLASQILLARSYTDISMNFIYFLCYLSFAFYIKNIKTRKRSCSSLVRPSAPRPRISAAVFYIFFFYPHNGFEGIEGEKSLIYRMALKMNKSKNNQKSIVSSLGEVKMARSKFSTPSNHIHTMETQNFVPFHQ